MSDELDDYEEGVERAEAVEDDLDQERSLANADQLADLDAEQDDTNFDQTRRAYSGVDDGDADVDVEELEEAGALLDDPSRPNADD